MIKASGDHLILNTHHAGQVLKRERQFQGLSQRDVAALLKSDQSTVSNWENDRISIGLLQFIRYANALGYDLMLTPKR